MFDQTTKQAWQSIGPDEALRERILAQHPGRVVQFPKKLARTVAAAAACLIVAVSVAGMNRPMLRVDGSAVRGSMTVNAGRNASRQVMTLSLESGVTVPVEAGDGVELTVSGGTLEDGLWTVDGPGDYVLWAKKGNRTQTYLLSCDAESGLWTLSPAD